MRKNGLILLLQLFAFVVGAQPGTTLHRYKEKLQYKGYNIIPQPCVGSSFGYDIVKGKNVIIHQRYNPVTVSPVGLSNKEDVYKVGRWEIDNFIEESSTNKTSVTKRNGTPVSFYRGTTTPLISNQPLSKKIAQQLQIKNARF